MDNRKLNEISNKIKAFLTEKGIKKSQLAEKMNVQPSVITRWLSGNHNFTVNTLFEIEKVLGIQLIKLDIPVNHSVIYEMKVSNSIFTGKKAA